MNEEIDLFQKKLNGYINKANSGSVVLTNFLDETQQELAKKYIKSTHLPIYFDGGFKNSEYQRAILSLYEVSQEDFKIALYEIIYPRKFTNISHRTILGSLMALGIKREVIGDIFISKEQKAYFACTDTISSYIEDNFSKVGASTITIKKCLDIIEEEKDYISKVDFVTSLRIDVLIAVGYHLSRSEAHQQIMDGNIKLNHLPLLNPSYMVKEKDIISFAHHGRMILNEVKGKSRSEKNVVEFLFSK